MSGVDTLQNSTIFLPHHDRNEIAKVLGRKRNKDGTYIGRKHKIPTLDSRIFTVQFPDGEEKDVGYNVLAEHLLSQCDSEGNQYRIFQGVLGHRRRQNAISKANGFRKSWKNKARKKTTAGYDFELEWKDGSI